MLLKPGSENTFKFQFISSFDKIIHFGVFVILAILLRFYNPKMSKTIYFILLFAYAALTEWLQDIMNLGRSMEFLDFVADSLGILVGIYIYTIIDKVFKDQKA